jgi:acyl-CoA thioester hydrolase
MPDASPWHVTTQSLRFSDNDSVGHVNNAIYAVMFEAGRTALINEAGVIDRGGPLAAVIARLEIDFKREMSWPGDVVIETAIERFGGKSIHMRQRVSKDGALAAEGLSVLVMIDRATRRPVPVSDQVRERFAPWALPGA